MICVQTESDVLGLLQYINAQQPDNPHLRLWEVAGTAHVDTYQLGPVADLFKCPKPVNAGPDHFIVADALAKLETWVVDGHAPPHAARLKVKPDHSDYVRDANGIAEGGVRTPEVDVPVDVLTGMPTVSPGSSPACYLTGSTTPIPRAKLAQMYPSRQDYLDNYEKATGKAIDAGFVLPADRREMSDDAQPDRIPG